MKQKKQKHRQTYRTSVMKFTQDQWHPAYKLDGYYRGSNEHTMVEVSLLEFYDFSGWRVCVWGADDDGMERDFTLEQKDQAKEVFWKVIEQPFVNKCALTNMGFVRA